MKEPKKDFSKIINRLVLFIGLSVLAHLIFVLLTTERHLLGTLKNLSVFHLLAIAILMFLPWVGYAFRVNMWSKFLGEKMTFRDALQIVITADVTSALSPTAVGGAPVKAGLLYNKGFQPGSIAFMLTWGVIEDIVFYTLGVVLAGYYSQGLLATIGTRAGELWKDNLVYIIIFMVIIGLYIVLISFNKLPTVLKIGHYLPSWIGERITKFKLGYRNTLSEMKKMFSMAWLKGKSRMLLSFTILLLQWMSKFSVLVIILYAFDSNIFNETPWVQVYIRQWFIYVTMLLIPTPGASGGAEASFLLIFGSAIPEQLSYLIVSIWRFFTYYWVLIMAVVTYIFLISKGKKKINAQ